MKLKDISMKELISQPLFWEDFEEDRSDPSAMKAAIEADPKSIEKIRFLDQVEDGTLLDRSTFHKLDFYEVEFTEYARLSLAEGEYEEDDRPRGKEVDYLKDYSGLRLLIQDVSDPLGECGVFALYLKDYEFGLINPLGLCVYLYEFNDDSRTLYKEDPEKFILEYVLLHLETEFWDEGFDLKQELFDYYHNMPDINNPLLESRTDLDGLITAKEAANLLEVSIPRIIKMIDERSIDGYKFAGRLLITRSSVENRLAYIKEHGKPTRGKAPKEKRIRRNNETSVFDSSSEYLQDKTKESFRHFLELRPNEQNKEYVIRVFEKLDDMNCISEYELKRLRANDADSVDYRRRTFGFRRPFYVESLSERREKSTGQDRYYAVPASGKYYLCAQWYFKESHTSYNLDKFQKWALRMFSGAYKESI